MSDRTLDDFDDLVRRALGDVLTATPPDPDLPERLITNTRAGRQVVVSLGARRARRWLAPLLAAAVVIVLALGSVTAVKLLAGPDTKPATSPTPLPTAPAELPPNFRPASVTFADEQHGWALGDAQCPSGAATGCPALAATTDGGGSWHAVGTPPGLVSMLRPASCSSPDVDAPCVNHVLFADDSVGYLWSLQETYVTTDAGKTWSRFPHAPDALGGATAMVIAGNSVIRIAAIQQCSAGCGAAVEIAPLGTVDFTRTDLPISGVALYGSRLGVHGDVAYLFGVGAGESDGVGIMRSTDGGTTWQSVATNPCDFPRAGAPGLVADDGALIVDCASGLRAAEPGSDRFTAPPGAPVPPSGYPVAAQSAQSITTTRLVAGAGVTDHTNYFRTEDGGLTWQRGVDVPFGQYSFTSGTVGYLATGDAGAYYVTHDGGLTWSPASFGG